MAEKHARVHTCSGLLALSSSAETASCVFPASGVGEVAAKKPRGVCEGNDSGQREADRRKVGVEGKLALRDRVVEMITGEEEGREGW
eukprot:4045056-Pleurochrysis_carterae.AAC.1